MSKVYFRPISSVSDTVGINKACEDILCKLVNDNEIKISDVIPLKVHFGEQGNETYIRSENYNGIYNFIEKNGADSVYMETNVLYRSKRRTSEDHKKVAAEHGFNKYPIIIADGDHGENYEEVEINKKHFKSCKIGAEYLKYNQMIVAAHFKGHILAGFGGACKQLAMGFASRGGKLAQHDNSKLVVREQKCTECGACAKQCPVEAISYNPKAFIDENKCVGCASCMIACKFGAIINAWSGQNDEFHERLAEYAYAAANDKQILYITFLLSVAEGCDCESHKMEIVGKDVGVLASLDPVALDKACYDKLNEKTGKTVFSIGLRTLEHAEEIGLGSMSYDIEEV